MRTVWLVLTLCLAMPAQAADAPIYRCETPAGTTFSDRPCGPASERYSPDLANVSVMTTVPAQPVAVKPTTPAVRKASAAPRDTKAESCARIEQSLRKIASTQRAGYTAKQGERLKERKRELDERRRDLRC